ncbi:MAG: HAMP domain-containing protein, partial [Deltaproteobacteria bacterium]
MRFSLSQKILIGFLLTLALFVVFLAVYLTQLERNRALIDLVSRIDFPVYQRLNEIRTLQKMQMVAMEKFLRTGDGVYVARFKELGGRIEHDFAAAMRALSGPEASEDTTLAALRHELARIVSICRDCDRLCLRIFDLLEGGETQRAKGVMEILLRRIGDLDQGFDHFFEAVEGEMGKRLHRVATLEHDRLERFLLFGGLVIVAHFFITAFALYSLRPVRALLEGLRRVGASAHLEPIAVRTRDEIGEITAAFNAMIASLARRDEIIHEQHKTLVGREKMLRTILESITGIVFVLDPERNVRQTNRPADGGGGPPEGKCHEIAFSHPSACVGCPLPEVLERKRPAMMELQVGRDRFFDISLYPIFSDRGEVAGIVEMIRDVSEQHRRRREMQSRENLARIGQLTTGIAHELRNSLSSIKMSIQTLVHREGISDNDRKRLEIANAEMRHLEKTLNGMLDFARPTRLNRRRTNLNDLLCDVIRVAKNAAQGKEIAFVCDFDPHLPEIAVDPDKMHQIAMNLYLNAIQAIAERGEIHVQTSRLDDGGGVRITIEDTGCGIAPEDRERIFEPFFTTKSRGIGLGLTNVRKIVEEHGGTIA